MRDARVPIAALVMLVLVAGCAPTGRFTWGTYEQTLYAYSKSPDQRAAYKLSLDEAIALGRTHDNIAPGLLAELGYLSLEDGDTAQAVALFQEEMERYPESRLFLTGIIERSQRAAPTQGAGS